MYFSFDKCKALVYFARPIIKLLILLRDSSDLLLDILDGTTYHLDLDPRNQLYVILYPVNFHLTYLLPGLNSIEYKRIYYSQKANAKTIGFYYFTLELEIRIAIKVNY